MKSRTLLLVILLIANSGCGQASSVSERYWSRGEPNAAYPSAQPTSGAYVVVPADGRMFMVQITSKQNDLEAQLNEFVAARDALRKAVESVGELTDFHVADPMFSADYSSSEKRSSDRNAIMVQVAFKLPQDPLKQLAAFAKAVASIKPPDGARWSYTLNGTGCVLNAPEAYREKLVAKAMEDLRALHGVDTSHFRVSVTGLEKPLAVSQYSDTQFLVSLQYSVTVESVTEAQVQPKPKAP